MTMQQLFAAMLGGWEIVLILATLLVLGFGVLVIIGIVLYISRKADKQTNAPYQAPSPPTIRRGGS
jgi:hypothetical protein